MNAKDKTRHVRPTLGFLTINVQGNISWAIWMGVVDAAERRDVNLLCFSAESLRDPRGSLAQANVLYDLVSTERLDGLVVWTSSVGRYLDDDENLAFLQRYGLPVVSLALPLEGIPTVAIDNYRGTHEAMSHLIENHGYRHIAFIRGPELHPAAEARWQAYRDALEEYDIPFESNLVTPPGNWGPATGAKGVALLLDERGLQPGTDIEAILAVSDSPALGALDALQTRKIQVPGEVALIGFDDAPPARLTAPPLTSVEMPFYEQGGQAVEALLSLLEGKEVPDQIVLPTRLVVRQSCGCQSPAVVSAAAHQKLPVVLAAQRETILSEIVEAVRGVADAPQQAERLLDGFVADVKGESPGTFLATLGGILCRGSTIAGKNAGGSIAVMQNAVSALRRSLLPTLDGEPLSRAEDLWQQARVMIGETAERNQIHQTLQVEQLAAALRGVGQALLAALDVGRLMDILADELPRLGIPSAYLSLYEDPAEPASWSKLMLAYGSEGRVELGSEGSRFPSPQIAPEEMWPKGRQVSFVVQPLYFQEQQLGFILLEVGPRERPIYEALRGHISSALRGVRLLEKHRLGEEALARERNLLHTLIDHLPDYVYVKDTAGRFVIGNMAVMRQIGLTSLDELVGKTDFDLFPEELAVRYHAAEQEIIQSGRGMHNYEGPTIDISKDEKNRWVSTTKVPLRDAQGKIIGSVGLGHDITEYKAYEIEREQLLASLERRALQLETAAKVSQAASGVLDPKELIQRAVDLIRERFDLYYAGLFLVGKIGSENEPGGKWAVLCAGTGEAGRGMLEQGHKLEIGGTSMVGWCVANKQARIALDVGQEAVRFDNPLLPETRSEMALPLVSRGRAIGALTIQSAQRAAFSEEDIRVLQTMADHLANAITNARLYDQAQQEIVERKRAEEALARQAQALDAELERFFFVASHHLQEPLRTVVSYSQLLQQRYQGKLDEEADEIISYAVGGAARIRTLINDMLAFARVTTRSNPFKLADSSVILNRVLSNLSAVIEGTGAKVTHDSLPMVMVDGIQLTQVFQHLLINAIQFRSDRPLLVHVSAERREGEWVFAIRDNGIGIEPQYADRIFQIFERLHGDSEYQGTGIGLAICKKIVERHGGRIWVESEPGEGSTFLFALPEQ